MLLDRISSPADLRDLDYAELDALSAEIRQFIGELRMARQKPLLKKGGADGIVFCSEAQAIANCTRAVTDLQAQIPQHVEHGFNHALSPRGGFVGGQEKEIDI